MKFEDIFKEKGWYKAKSFRPGVAFVIDDNYTLHIIEWEIRGGVDGYPINYWQTKYEIQQVYAGLFQKEYEKVLSVKSLF